MASSSSSTSIVNTTASPSTTSLTTIHHLITIKLTCDNYLVWKAPIVPSLRGNISMAISTEPHLLHLELSWLDGATQALQNPEFQHWHLQDQMILSAIISYLSEKILAHVVKFTTSWDAWKALECMFTSQSRPRTMQIHYQLATLKKWNSSIADYFPQFTTLVDTLAASTQPLNNFEIVSFLLASLGSNCDSVVTLVTTRVDPLSI